ncbi:hypothetical protein [Candidatus Palauibacter sp.]|uniref:hypothetical protein n=1 Tax=Candidatus Palauibacter sp. TaxID=3101350 RepID=UPI003B02AC69
MRSHTARGVAVVPAAAILGSLAACGEPPVEWPESSPFPTEVIQFGMTFADLRLARPDIVIDPDEGSIEDAYYGNWLHYGFTSWGANGPVPRSRLVYVDLVQTDLTRERAESWWSSRVADLSVDLGVEPRCSTMENGRLTWRRATLRPLDSPLAAAVEMHVMADAPGSATAELTTRMWLPEYATPLADATDPPGGGNQLPRWEPCVVDAERGRLVGP